MTFSPHEPVALIRRPNPPRSPQIRVVPRAALRFDEDGPRRGYAHAGFDEVPKHSPWRLEFEPLILFAEGEMRPREGFDMHRHENVDNLLLVREGKLRHRDSFGNSALLRAGHASLLAAGAGIEHSEVVEGNDCVRGILIWIRPEQTGGTSAYHLRDLDGELKDNRWLVVASGLKNAPKDALPLRRDAQILQTTLRADGVIEQYLAPGRRAYVVPLDSPARINQKYLRAGDRALIEGPGPLSIVAEAQTQVLLVDLGAPLAGS